MILVGDIVAFIGSDADLGFGAPRMGEVVSSHFDDKGCRWHWMESETGMMAQFTESELVVVLKAQTPYERFNGKSSIVK